jgi:hypothetical protein
MVPDVTSNPFHGVCARFSASPIRSRNASGVKPISSATASKKRLSGSSIHDLAMSRWPHPCLRSSNARMVTINQRLNSGLRHDDPCWIRASISIFLLLLIFPFHVSSHTKHCEKSDQGADSCESPYGPPKACQNILGYFFSHDQSSSIPQLGSGNVAGHDPILSS